MPETSELTGKHLIAGEWVEGGKTFRAALVDGDGAEFCSGGAAEIDRAARAAEEAFATYGWTTREARAAFLETIADEIEARGADLTLTGSAETGLPAARLEGERGRTTGQLRLFAAHIRKGDYLDRRHDPALPDRQPLPRPDLRLMERPIGPVGVFGASNFPLAFSTAGGDTASALAAGCPVVVKGHPGHPGTGEIVAQAILAAIEKTGMPKGVFSLVQSHSFEAGEALVTHPLIRAVGFTGSFRGGKALFDLAMARPEPIPFFGELGAINPVFVFPAAMAARGETIARDWAGSLNMGVGQFCTNPGVLIVLEGDTATGFSGTATDAMAGAGSGTMLHEGIAQAYRSGVETLSGQPGVTALTNGDQPGGRLGGPALFEVSGADFLAQAALSEEVFGPSGLLIRCKDLDEMRAIAAAVPGQLTITLQIDGEDAEAAASLMPVLERKAGRILANGFPTGVEVADAMVHGGPYPATTNFGATSVGTLAIRRFLRPVCYQNLPAALLPEDLRD